MDRTISLLSAVAWPLVTLVIALIFRREFKAALGRLGRFKYLDFEVTFQQDLREAEQLASSLPPPPPSKEKDSIVLELSPAREQPFIRTLGALSTPPKEREAFENLAEQSPRSAIEKSWKRLTRSLERVGHHRLSESEARLVKLLRKLSARRFSPDDLSPTTTEARRFIDLAESLVTRLESRA